MKVTVIIVASFFINLCYAQDDNNNEVIKPSEYIEVYVITSSCSKLSTWKEKKKCSGEEIVDKAMREISTDNAENLKENKYRVWYSFFFDEKGHHINTTVRAKNKIVETEFEIILKKLDLDITKQNAAGSILNGRFDFPMYFMVQN